MGDGKCAWCDEVVDLARMGMHLRKHLDMTITPARGRAAQKGKGKPKGKTKGKGGAARRPDPQKGAEPAPNRDAFVLKIVAGDDADYWMFVRAHGLATLSDLDDLLREVWAGCCPEHDCHFTIRGTRYHNEDGAPDADGGDDVFLDDLLSALSSYNEEWSLDVPLRKAIYHKTRFEYVFDRRNPMEASITAYATASSAKMDAPIGLLARNEPPRFECGSCNAEDASKVCIECAGARRNPLYCIGCAAEHACGDKRTLPVENTPRLGQCPYEGLPDSERKDRMMHDEHEAIRFAGMRLIMPSQLFG